jgi:ferredoxin
VEAAVIRPQKDKCMAHGVCMQLAPDVFVPDEDGYVALVPGQENSDDEPRVRLAAENCPMQAILLDR